MKHEQCRNCTQSKFRERFERAPGLLGFLFGIFNYNFRVWIRCYEANQDISPDEYDLICNIGCGSFRDNNPKKAKV